VLRDDALNPSLVSLDSAGLSARVGTQGSMTTRQPPERAGRDEKMLAAEPKDGLKNEDRISGAVAGLVGNEGGVVPGGRYDDCANRGRT
jgi:hypothetical protein